MKRSPTVILCRKAVRYSGNLCKHIRVNQEKEPAEQQQKEEEGGRIPSEPTEFSLMDDLDRLTIYAPHLD